jgi:hypothetical protein
MAAAPPLPRVSAPPSTLAEAAQARLERVERVIGAEVSKVALGVITAAIDGVSWVELADILACDDQVKGTFFCCGTVFFCKRWLILSPATLKSHHQ